MPNFVPNWEETYPNYRLEKILGRGGMGVVYLAQDIRLRRAVAIKCIHSEAFDNDRLLKEAQLLAQINHPNVVQLYDIIQSHQNIALIMEYVTGGNLQSVLRASNPTTLQRIEWLAQVADGLHAAHKRGIIHRDIKLENVLLSENQRVKLTDFGIAKDLISNEDQTQENLIKGTYSAMSPEQITGEPLDARSDLFSLGLLSYQVLAGRSPYPNANNGIEIAHSILNEAPTPIVFFEPRLPSSVQTLLADLLNKDVQARPSNAARVADTFRDCINDVQTMQNGLSKTIDANISKIPTKESPIKPEHVKKLPMPFASYGFLVLAMLACLTTLHWHRQAPTKALNYVAVRYPKVTVHSAMPIEQQRLLQNVVYQSLQEGVLDDPNRQLVPVSEIENIENIDSSESKTGTEVGVHLGPYLGATQIIDTQLDCDQNDCRVIFSLRSGNQWNINKQVHWETLIDSYLDIKSASLLHLGQLLGNDSNQRTSAKHSGTISETDYRRYLSLYAQIKFEGQDLQTSLGELATMQQAAPAYEPIYVLYKEVALDLYHDTYDDRYLTMLQAMYEKAFYHHPNSDHIKTIKYWVAAYMGDYPQAKAVISDIEKHRGLTEETHYLRGYLYYLQGTYEKADQHYQKARALRPSRKIFYNLSINEFSRGNYQQAKHYVNKVFALSPQDNYAKSVLANIALSEGDFKLAKKLFLDVIEKTPHAIYHSNLGLVLLLSGEYDAALIHFQKAQSLSPDHPLSYLNLADLQLLLGDNKSATKNYLKVIELSHDATFWQHARNKAQAHLHLGDHDLAIALTKKSQQLSPDNPEVDYSSALVYTQIGEFQSALYHIDKALQSGMGLHWFSLPWFKPLCDTRHISLYEKGEATKEICRAIGKNQNRY